MRDKLFIAIGVSKAKGLVTLPGVWNSVRAMAEWAGDTGYDTVAITDEGDHPVDVARVKAEVKAKLRPALSRIVLYFAGHGYSVPPEQYLILSAGPAVPDQRIARDGLRDMLATYGPEQIAVMIDACMVRKPLKGLAASVLDPEDGEVPKQYFDGFYATQDGSQAFAFRETPTDPELCLFSWVLHRGLTFKDEDACDKHEAGRGRRVVTSYSLGDYLDRAVPDEAALREVWQQPQTNTGFRPPNHIYNEDESLGADEEDELPDLDDGFQIDYKAGFQPQGFQPFWPGRFRPGRSRSSEPPPRRPHQPLEDRVRSEWRRPFTRWALDMAHRTGSRLILDVLRGGRLAIRSQGGARVRLAPVESFYGQGWRDAYAAKPLDRRDEKDRRSEAVLLELGSLCSLVPLYDGLWSVVQTEKGRGAIAIAWGSYDVAPSDQISPLEVLKGLLTGRLTALDIPEIAGLMRQEKHRDPLNGVVASYLYDTVGDIENIRRMCYYYEYFNQDVPFDIALLSRLPIQSENGRLYIEVPRIEAADDRDGPSYTFEATPACRATVAGFAPLLRAGWSKLPSTSLWGGRLAALADNLTENPIATFRGKDAQEALLALIANR